MATKLLMLVIFFAIMVSVGIYMDRSWECDYRKFAGMGCTRKTYQGYDTAFEF